MKIQENILLAPYTTFKIGGRARFFCIVKNETEVVEAVKFAKEKVLPILVLGGGSNVLICDDGYPGLVIKNEIKGIDFDNTTNPQVIISAGAGESWDGFVDQAVSHKLFGIENLSAIPGTVGATPVQNIGAYGVEVSNVIESVRAFDMKNMTFADFKNSDCKFDYRDSVFKHERGRYIVTKVSFKLSSNGVLQIDYKDVREYLDKHDITNPSLSDLRHAIVEIRAAKLPDWSKWGTAGSFFKNPTVSPGKFEELKKQYPGLPGFPDDLGNVKVSLGWILDKICDARGMTVGKVGTYDKQALVMVAQPGAKASEVLSFSQELTRRVKEKTGITIEAEVEWVC